MASVKAHKFFKKQKFFTWPAMENLKYGHSKNSPFHQELKSWIYFLYLEFGLGHMTCFGQWDIKNQEISRGVKSIYTLGLALSRLWELRLPYEEAWARLIEGERSRGEIHLPSWATPSQNNCPSNPQNHEE